MVALFAQDPKAASCVPPGSLRGLRGPTAEPAAGKGRRVLAAALGSPLPPRPFPSLQTGSPTIILQRERGRVWEQRPGTQHGDRQGQGRCWTEDGRGKMESCVPNPHSQAVVTVLPHQR